MFKKVALSSFLKNNMIFFAGSMFVAFLNYLYYPILGRMLDTSSFGELQVAVSLLMQLTTVLSVLALLTVTILVGEKDKNKAQRTIKEIEKIAIILGLAVLLLMCIVASPLRESLKFQSIWPLVLTAGIFFASIPLSFRVATLRAYNDFTGASASGIVLSVVKIICSAALVYVGLSSFGAIAGILLAQIIALFYTAWRARRYVSNQGLNLEAPNIKLVKPYAKYALFTITVSLLITTQVSIDVAIVKYYFSPTDAGLYAGIATVARIIFFVAASTTAVLASSVSTKLHRRQNRQTFLKSLVLTVVLTGSATLFFCLFPKFTLHLLLGERYDVYQSLLPLLSVATFVASIASLIGTYCIAMRYYAALVPVMAGTVLTLLLTLFAHESLESIIINLLIGSLLMLVGLSVVVNSKLKM